MINVLSIQTGQGVSGEYVKKYNKKAEKEDANDMLLR